MALASDLTQLVAESTNVLLLDPPSSVGTPHACNDLLSAASSRQIDVLATTFSQRPKDWYQERREHFDSTPERAAVITDKTRGAVSVEQERLQTHTVSSPGDLTGLGIAVSEVLEMWASNPTLSVVCFESLTHLLQYSDAETVFRFLHTLTGRVETSDAFAHYHINPAAHDDQIIESLSPLFDAIVRPDGDDIDVTT